MESWISGNWCVHCHQQQSTLAVRVRTTTRDLPMPEAARGRALFRPTSDRVWKIFARLRIAAFDKDFIRRALWRKLTVAQRLSAMTRQDHCPFEPPVETHQHFFEGCKFTEFLGS